MSETAEAIIARTVDTRFLAPSTRGSRFAAKLLARAIIRDLALAGFSVRPAPTNKGDVDGTAG